MKKEIKSIGTSLGIYFDKEDCRIYNFEEGDVIELEPVIIKKRKSHGVQK